MIQREEVKLDNVTNVSLDNIRSERMVAFADFHYEGRSRRWSSAY